MSVINSKKVIQISLRKDTLELMNNILEGTNKANKEKGEPLVTKSMFIEIALHHFIISSLKSKKAKEEN